MDLHQKALKKWNFQVLTSPQLEYLSKLDWRLQYRDSSLCVQIGVCVCEGVHVELIESFLVIITTYVARFSD